MNIKYNLLKGDLYKLGLKEYKVDVQTVKT